MVKEWQVPKLEVLDVQMTMKGQDPFPSPHHPKPPVGDDCEDPS